MMEGGYVVVIVIPHLNSIDLFVQMLWPRTPVTYVMRSIISNYLDDAT